MPLATVPWVPNGSSIVVKRPPLNRKPCRPLPTLSLYHPTICPALLIPVACKLLAPQLVDSAVGTGTRVVDKAVVRRRNSISVVADNQSCVVDPTGLRDRAGERVVDRDIRAAAVKEPVDAAAAVTITADNLP